ncbi:MAG: hypothetical protein ACREYF_00980 [Gammaproteobacteria bacterium]
MHPQLRAEKSIQLARAVFGTENWKIIIWGILFFLTLSWFGDSTVDLIPKNYHPYMRWLMVGLFPVLILILIWRIRQAPSHVNIVVVQRENPPACRVLILFLSPPGDDKEKLETMQHQALSGEITDKTVREQFVGSWRMPLEAIAHHLDHLHLEKVIVVPSKDSPRKADGTIRFFDLFVSLVKSLVAKAKPRLELIGLHQIADPWSQGVDFEDAEALVGALDQIFEWLRQSKIKEYEVMIDVTGGQKVPTIAGTMVSLGESRRLQYVSTRDYKVRSYDITYRART